VTVDLNARDLFEAADLRPHHLFVVLLEDEADLVHELALDVLFIVSL